MFGSKEIGEHETDVTIGEKVIGQDQLLESGLAVDGNRETVVGIGDKVIGDRKTKIAPLNSMSLFFFLEEFVD
jgi:hypothetical protein